MLNSGLAATASVLALAVAALPSAASAQTEQQQDAPQKPRPRPMPPTRPMPPRRPTRPATRISSSPARASRGRNFDTLQPSVIIGSEEIEARGFETLGQAINEQPAFGVPAPRRSAAQAGSFGSGQSFVNFLGLGGQRTLVLVNGRRFVCSNTASIFGPTSAGTQVDLNTINTKLVDRVETIAIGGAPIYGSDAIAGTVNIILRRDYEGVELDAQYGISEQGDAPNYRVRGLWGANFADGRGNVTVVRRI